MKKAFFPQTTVGKIGLGLTALAVFLVALFFFIEAVFDPQSTGGEGFFSIPALTIPILSAWIAGSGSFFCAVVAILIKKDKSLWMILPLLLGAFVLWFGLAEFLWGE